MTQPTSGNPRTSLQEHDDTDTDPDEYFAAFANAQEWPRSAVASPARPKHSGKIGGMRPGSHQTQRPPAPEIH